MLQITVTSKINRTDQLRKNLAALTKRQTLVGVPSTTASRKQGTGPTNALLAYVHDNGSPARGIPAREFLRPGIKDAQKEIEAKLGQTARQALDGSVDDIEKGLMAVGLIAQKAVRRKITQGPFVPLKPGTLAARRRRGRKGTKPLIDTGALRQAISFSVRNKP